LSERRPAAIALWLQGEREYRQSQFLRAFDYYGRAVKEDSALALAAVKGAQAADWMGYGADARGFVTAALRHEDKLPPKYTQLAHGLQSFLTGRADSAIARYRMALQLDPAWSEAWMALGDVYFHLLPNESPLDSLALRAFTEARRADPEFIPPLFHIVEMSLRGPDLARADTLLAEFRRFNPDSTWTLQLGLMAACRKQGPGSSEWATAGSKHGDELFYAAKGLAATGAHWGCSEAGLRQLIGSDSVAINYRRAALLILQSILVAQGRYEGAARLIDSAAARGMPAAKNLYLVDAAAGAPFDQKAEAVLDGLVEGTKTLEGPKLWFQGSWYAHTGNAARLTRVVEQLQDKVRSTADPLDSLLAESMTARLDLVRGDTLSAKNRLLALRPCATLTYITWGLWQSLAPERMALAEILLAQNEPARAIEVASGFDQIEPAVYILYWPRSLALRYRAAAKLGRTDLAERYAARLREIGRTDLLQVQVSSEHTPTRREP
jgi:tetratricopeptide (TPR) repeat protein